MKAWRKLINDYKSISWLLIAALLILTLLPAHYHLHHASNVDFNDSAHTHMVDLHVLANTPDNAHHDSREASFTAAPDGIIKKQNSAFAFFFILAVFLIFLPILYSRKHVHSVSRDISPARTPFYLCPPLRAPPLA